MAADIVFKTVAFPIAYVGEAYEAGIGHNSAATAITAGSITTGALPDGLVVNATDHVRITGTPTKAGTFSFKITLTDSGGAVESGSYTIKVVHGDPDPDNARTMNIPVAAQLARAWPNE